MGGVRCGRSLVDRFKELCDLDAEAQAEFFLKSFIFALGDKWKEVPSLCREFTKHAKNTGPSSQLMSHIQAADFLQKHQITRTGLERKREVEDIDYNTDGKICFLEYALLHYKIMILKEYYARMEMEPVEDLSGDGVGLLKVGDKLLDELFTMPRGLSPALEKALEDFTVDKKAKEKKIQTLEAKVQKGGVLGMAAKNELLILEKADQTDTNRIEITLQAAKRKATKTSGEEALTAAKIKEAKQDKEDRDKRRAAMKARANFFDNNNKKATTAA